MTDHNSTDSSHAHDVALHELVKRIGLSEAEAAALTLNDLSLGGNEPSIHVWDEARGGRREVALDEATHRALVNWVLVRADSASPLIFPGEEGDGLTEAEVKRRVARVERVERRRAARPATKAPAPPSLSETEIEEERLPDPKTLFAPAPPPPAPFTVQQPSSRPETVRPPAEPVEEAIAAEEPELVAEEQPAVAAGEVPAAIEDEVLVSEPSIFKMGRPEAGETPEAEPETPQDEPWSEETRPRPFYTPLLTTGILTVCCLGGLALAILQGENIYNWARGFLPPGEAAPVAAVSPSPTPFIADSPVLPTPTTAAPTDTPAPTPSPTPTPLPTDTPPPDDSPTPVPTDTLPPPTPPPTATATPTPQPTDTPASETAAPPEPPGPTPATPGFKYEAPVLLDPPPGFEFIQGNTIDLTWQEVDLAGDEQYAVRLVYFHQNEVVYRGQQVRQPIWTVPFDFYRDADGPEFKYTWFVFIERVNADGSTVPISPESEPRDFFWR
ncbi:MAG: hypothetical protein ACE5H9_03390 [Anaerolineae bacterium]